MEFTSTNERSLRPRSNSTLNHPQYFESTSTSPNDTSPPSSSSKHLHHHHQEHGFLSDSERGLDVSASSMYGGPVGPLRKGKWTVEEESYANKIIYMFNKGILQIPLGTTLRSYLSEKLNCDPMRITKKFAGPSCIGKQIFQPAEPSKSDNSSVSIEEIRECELELSRLEHAFLARQGGGTGSSPNAAQSSRYGDSRRGSGSGQGLKHSSSLLAMSPATVGGSGPPSARLKVDSGNDYGYSFSPQRNNSGSPSSVEEGGLLSPAFDSDSPSRVGAGAGVGGTGASFLPLPNHVKPMRRSHSAPELVHMHSGPGNLFGVVDGHTEYSQNGGPFSLPFAPPGGVYPHPPFFFGPPGAFAPLVPMPLGHLAMTTPSDSSSTFVDGNAGKGMQRSRKRCQSMVDLLEFESYYQSDSAAGDLLLNFFHSLHNRSSNKKFAADGASGTLAADAVSGNEVKTANEAVTAVVESKSSQVPNSDTLVDTTNGSDMLIVNGAAADQYPSPGLPSTVAESLADSPSDYFQLGPPSIDEANKLSEDLHTVGAKNNNTSGAGSNIAHGTAAFTDDSRAVEPHLRANSDTTSSYTHASSVATSRDGALLSNNNSFEVESSVKCEEMNESL